MPKIFNRDSFADFKDYYYAHRGLHSSSVPENSITAFKNAVDKGYGIELDVRLTKDDVPVVFHDHSIKRMCDVDIDVRDLTFSELKEYRLLNSAESIPKFTEVLDLINGRVPIIVELKVRNDSEKTSEIVANILDNYKGIYCIESFNPKVVLWFKKNRPHVIRGQLSTRYSKVKGSGNRLLNFILQNYGFNLFTKPDFIAFNHKHKNMLSFTLCRKLYRVPTIAYTITSQEELEESKDYFDYFIFENFEP